jgi:hypothetical protein
MHRRALLAKPFSCVHRVGCRHGVRRRRRYSRSHVASNRLGLSDHRIFSTFSVFSSQRSTAASLKPNELRSLLWRELRAHDVPYGDKVRNCARVFLLRRQSHRPGLLQRVERAKQDGAPPMGTTTTDIVQKLWNLKVASRCSLR